MNRHSLPLTAFLLAMLLSTTSISAAPSGTAGGPSTLPHAHPRLRIGLLALANRTFEFIPQRYENAEMLSAGAGARISWGAGLGLSYDAGSRHTHLVPALDVVVQSYDIRFDYLQVYQGAGETHVFSDQADFRLTQLQLRPMLLASLGHWDLAPELGVYGQIGLLGTRRGTYNDVHTYQYTTGGVNQSTYLYHDQEIPLKASATIGIVGGLRYSITPTGRRPWFCPDQVALRAFYTPMPLIKAQFTYSHNATLTLSFPLGTE